MDLGRHDRVGFVEEPDDRLPSLRSDDSILVILRQDCDREKGDGNAQEHAFGKTDECAHLVVEAIELYAIDYTGDEPKNRPDDE